MMDAYIGVMAAGALLVAGLSLLVSRGRADAPPPRQRRQLGSGIRRPRVTPDKWRSIAKDLAEGRLRDDEIAVRHGVSTRTVGRAAAAQFGRDCRDVSPAAVATLGRQEEFPLEPPPPPPPPPPRPSRQSDRRRPRYWRHAIPLALRVDVAKGLTRTSNAAVVARRHGVSGDAVRHIRPDVAFLTNPERVAAAVNSARAGACAQAIAALHGCTRPTAKAIFRDVRDKARQDRAAARRPSAGEGM